MSIKQETLKAVDQLNEDFDTKLRIKSKTLPLIVQTLNAALAAIDPCKLYTEANPEMMDVFATAKVDLPEAPSKKEMKKYKKALKEAAGMSADSVTSENPDDYDGKEEYDAAAHEHEPQSEPESESESEPEPKLSKKTKKAIEIIEAKVIKLKDKLSSCKKKKAKKIQAKIDSLYSEASELMVTTEIKPAAKPRTGGNAKGQKRPGIILTIKDILTDTDKPLTADKILKQLLKRIPEANPDTVPKTIRAQLYCKEAPCRLEKEKGEKLGFTVIMSGEAKERTFIINQ